MYFHDGIAGAQPAAVIGWLAYVSGLIDHYEPLIASEFIQDFALDKVCREVFIITPKALGLLQQ